ncbi:MAG: hypothetical protein CSA81_09100 [Acidobacteria bacterium]|nr:MAG: hypothetical protein CSA81_09100 [Acidobacteriota bacterium]
MNKCFCCGETLLETDEHCRNCRIDRRVLREIGNVHTKPAFLFGSVDFMNPDAGKETQKPPSSSVKQVQEPVVKATSEALIKSLKKTSKEPIEKPLVKPKPKRQKQKIEEASLGDKAIEFRDTGLQPLVRAVEKKEAEANGFSKKTDRSRSLLKQIFSIVLDFVFLVFLNSLVTLVASYQTARPFNVLYVYSLIPMLLAHCAISAVLFALFIQYFGHSPGTLIVKKSD